MRAGEGEGTDNKARSATHAALVLQPARRPRPPRPLPHQAGPRQRAVRRATTQARGRRPGRRRCGGAVRCRAQALAQTRRAPACPRTAGVPRPWRGPRLLLPPSAALHAPPALPPAPSAPSPLAVAGRPPGQGCPLSGAPRRQQTARTAQHRVHSVSGVCVCVWGATRFPSPPPPHTFIAVSWPSPKKCLSSSNASQYRRCTRSPGTRGATPLSCTKVRNVGSEICSSATSAGAPRSRCEYRRKTRRSRLRSLARTAHIPLGSSSRPCTRRWTRGRPALAPSSPLDSPPDPGAAAGAVAEPSPSAAASPAMGTRNSVWYTRSIMLNKRAMWLRVVRQRGSSPRNRGLV